MKPDYQPTPTYADVSFDRADVIPILEAFESDERIKEYYSRSDLLRVEDPAKVDLNEVLGANIREHEKRDILREWDSGGEARFTRSDGHGEFNGGEYGPIIADTGDIFRIGISFAYSEVRGESIFDKHEDIVRKHSAPYLDRSLVEREGMQDNIESGHLGTMEVPLDYDEDVLKESYETAMTRIDKAQELQRIAKSSIDDFEV